MTKIEYTYKSSAMEHKGWMHGIYCYSGSMLLYHLYIVSEDTIIYHNKFCTSEGGNLKNIDYISNI